MQDNHANARQVSMALARKKKATKAKAAARPKVKPAGKSAKSKSDRSKSTPSKSKSHQTKPDPLDDLIVAAARALALTVEPAWKPAVRANLQVIFAQAALVTAFELPDDAEPAPIFKA
jgi:Protein of unknown function (DUF4089)